MSKSIQLGNIFFDELEVLFMNNQDILNQLYQLTTTEEIAQQALATARGEAVAEEPNYEAFERSDAKFAFFQRERFRLRPLHAHRFIELTYVYAGSFRQQIAGEKVTMTRGQLSLLDQEILHSAEPLGKEDIVFTFLVKRTYFLEQMSYTDLEKGLVFHFIVNALSENQAHNQFIIFDQSQDQKIRAIMEQIILEQAEQEIGSKKIMENLLSILFTMLVRVRNYQTNRHFRERNDDIIFILQYIDANYLSVTLPELAQRFSYSASYISYLIKKETKRTFSQLVLEKKLNQVRYLVKNTQLSIQQCAEDSGFSNLTYFYDKYKEFFGNFPSEDR